MKIEKVIKDTNPRKSFLSFIELGVILLFTFVKSTRFYAYIGLAEYSYTAALITAAVLLVLYTALLLCTKKNPSTAVISVYFVMCLLMFVDRLYFTYFGSLPGIIKLKLIKYMVGVTDSVGALFSLSHFLFIIDIPIIMVYLIFIRKRVAHFVSMAAERVFYYAKIAAPILCAVLIITSLLLLHIAGGYYPALKNEVFFYHTTDVLSTFIPFGSDSEVDAAKYIAHDTDSRYAGIAEGRNLINIQVEALNEFPIGLVYEGQEITPNLNKLLEADTVYFDNYYWCVLGGGGTSDAEFAVNNSLYAPSAEATYDTYTDHDYFGIPFLLKANGYKGAYVFHGYDKTFWNRDKAYPFQGFDAFIGGSDFETKDVIGLGITDEDFYEQTVECLVTYEQPFYAFLVTLSSHHPFTLPDEYKALTLNSSHEDTMFGNYLQSIHYTDRALGYMLDLLKENGLYDNSVITIYGDHYGLGQGNDDGLTSTVIGKEYDREEYFKIPLIVHIPGSDVCETVSTTGSHVDYAPTVLALLGIENDRSVMIGQNLLSEDTVGRVYGQHQMSMGGFITDEVIGEVTATGLIVKDKETGELLDPAEYQQISDSAFKTIDEAHYILENNLIRAEKIN